MKIYICDPPSCSRSWASTASAIGIIMAVAVVLLIHMDSNSAANMKPNSNLLK